MNNSTFTALMKAAPASEEACVAQSGRDDLIAFCIIVIIGVLWNALVLWSIIVSRKKLKQNYVYMFVASVVSANIALGVLMVFTLLTFLLAFERPYTAPGTVNSSVYDQSNSAHVNIMEWYAFRKTLLVGLFLVMSSSVVALVGGIVASTHFVGRTSGASTKLRFRSRSPSDSSDTKTLTPRRRAALFIALSWILPFLYTCLIFAWSCVDFCDCLPAYYNKLYFCFDENDVHKCSNVWTPMTNGHLLLAVVFWLINAVAIFVLLSSAIARYRSILKPNTAGSDEAKETKGAVTVLSIRIDETSSDSDPVEQTSPSAERAPFHPTIKLLIALSVTYTLCTAPMMICFVVDAFMEDREGVSDIAVTVSSLFVFVYTFICPGFLVTYMPGLRTAIVRFLLPCTCATSTEADGRFAALRRK